MRKTIFLILDFIAKNCPCYNASNKNHICVDLIKTMITQYVGLRDSLLISGSFLLMINDVTDVQNTTNILYITYLYTCAIF